ncbi:50S ribosomal protein L17 [Candidatus Daviesbacteria bacterium]|nr:50S ribosomal protein L17 [Candidatus Daviesbacteria bacterium]
MRHKVYGKHLGRDKNQRTALLRGLVRSLLLHESITTTKAKAAAIKGLMDRLIVKSKEKTNASLNVVHSTLPNVEISKKLIEEIAPRYQKRTSGFTRTVKVGRRLGDGALMVKMSLIEADQVEPKKEKTVVKKEK